MNKECENCAELLGQLEQKDIEQQALMDQCVKFEKQIEMLQGAFADMAATIRRLTEERTTGD